MDTKNITICDAIYGFCKMSYQADLNDLNARYHWLSGKVPAGLFEEVDANDILTDGDLPHLQDYEEAKKKLGEKWVAIRDNLFSQVNPAEYEAWKTSLEGNA